MPVTSSFIELLRGVLSFAAALALLPLRLLAMVTGGLLVFTGLLGLPVWLVQLLISLIGGGAGGGPLAVWEMCLLLGLAIPVGVVFLEFADVPSPRLPTQAGESSPSGLSGEIRDWNVDQDGGASAAFGESGAPVLPNGAGSQPLGGIQAAYTKLAQHEIRRRVANARHASLRGRRRGTH